MKQYYKKIIIAFFFSMQFSFLNAQWVTIPDSNFVNWLDANGFASCMNGNLMDTTCNAVASASTIDCSYKNISDLDGIQYFDNLLYLSCNDNLLVNLPNLPNSLVYLICRSNQLTSLPVLPAGLTNLDCGTNLLNSLPTLPGALKVLNCQLNQLTSLPSLPDSLMVLECHANSLNSLPLLPNTVYDLYCSSNQLTNLPPLPDSLKFLVCDYNQINSLPVLPDSLSDLYCSHNQLNNLPTLPVNLKYLYCGYNQISSLPALPDSLYLFTCTSNQLTTLPALPDSLFYFDCALNQLTDLPSLPHALRTLECSNNQLDSLPSLPTSLLTLNCSNNLLSSLPSMPISLYQLAASYNQVTSIASFPDSLDYCVISFNPNLTCLPELKRIVVFEFLVTGIQCLPNYGNVTTSTPPLSSLPLCDVFNTNNCTAYWNISGKVYSDTNNNCIADNNELRLSNIKLLLDSAGTLIQQTYTGGEGFYSFDTDTGTYTYTVDTTDLPVLVTCPAVGFQTSVLTAVDSMDYGMDFGMQCKAGFDVGVTSVARDSGVFRPAHFGRVKIAAGDVSNFYGLHCAAGTGGSVQVVFSGGVSYVGATAGALAPVVSGDTLFYSIADFGTVNYNADFSFTVQTDTAAASGSQVCFDVNVSPTAGDINPANNTLHYCFTVVNSFDPNTKEVSPQASIDTSQHWLTYTINFQNTGTAVAQHIYILDTLDNSFDESSFTLLSYSFQPLTQLIGKVIRFNFPNINLPDSTSDEPHSHGYVQYKVKIKPGLTNGTLIHNTADIIFDFNTPVITNTTENQIMITTNLTPNPSPKERGIWFSPNPFHNSTLLKITSPMKSGNYTLEIYNVIGEKMREINCVNKSEIVIERKNLEAGIYIFKLFNERELMGTGKLVVE
jgi:uncharacterized repeat protein (TIGR01451 family)